MNKENALGQILSAAMKNGAEMEERLVDTLESVGGVYSIKTAATVKAAYEMQIAMLDLLVLLEDLKMLPDTALNVIFERVIGANTAVNCILFHLALDEALPIGGVQATSPAYLDLDKTYEALLKTYLDERTKLRNQTTEIVKREGL
jgi:hypothetical protein